MRSFLLLVSPLNVLMKLLFYKFINFISHLLLTLFINLLDLDPSVHIFLIFCMMKWEEA